MVLAYFNSGERSYGTEPVAAGRARHYWEFQAVVRGRIGRVLPAAAEGEPGESRLWVSGPDSRHGWRGVPGEVAEVVVFHYPYVPEVISGRVGRSGCLEVLLGDGERERVRLLGERAKRYWGHPSPGIALCSESILWELGLLAYERGGFEAEGPRGDWAWQVVREILGIYGRRMEENPKLESMAREAGVSAPHLRRLFRAVFGRPPKAVLEEQRYQRVMQLLRDSDWSLAEIAERTGFSEPSAFSRAVKLRFGCPPSRLR